MPALLAALLVTLMPDTAMAAAAEGAPHLDGSVLGLVWGIPFVGILLSIALMPLFTPHFWHHHYGKVSAFWALAFLVPFVLQFGPSVALYQVLCRPAGQSAQGLPWSRRWMYP